MRIYVSHPSVNKNPPSDSFQYCSSLIGFSKPFHSFHLHQDFQIIECLKQIYKMQNVLAIVHLKGTSTLYYADFAKELSNAGNHLFAERLHHFLSVKDSDILIADVWKSAEVFSRYIDILIPIALENGFTPKAEINALFQELS
jgi:hypothetical protein